MKNNIPTHKFYYLRLNNFSYFASLNVKAHKIKTHHPIYEFIIQKVTEV